jgi:hypothetical protein
MTCGSELALHACKRFSYRAWAADKPLGCGADGVAVFKDIPFMTSKGPVTASIPNAAVK